MSGPSAPDAVVDHLISALYCRGAEIEPDRFRRWALNELRSLLDFDAAIWGSGPVQRPQFHNVTAVGVPQEFARALEDSQLNNPLLPRIKEQLGEPVDMCDVLDDDSFFSSALYRETFAPFGIQRILSSASLQPRSGLYTLLSLYRFNRDRQFSEQDRAIQGRVLHHLIRSAGLVYFLAISRPLQGQRQTPSAVCDRQGVLHEVEDSFLELIERYWPDWPGQVLPFPMPSIGQTKPCPELHLSVELLDDLLLLRLREVGPLDQLTPRELDVVMRVCRGLSAKAIGRELDMAPSTVSTHLYRAFDKLGVGNRTELAHLVQGLRDH